MRDDDTQVSLATGLKQKGGEYECMTVFQSSFSDGVGAFDLRYWIRHGMLFSNSHVLNRTNVLIIEVHDIQFSMLPQVARDVCRDEREMP